MRRELDANAFLLFVFFDAIGIVAVLTGIKDRTDRRACVVECLRIRRNRRIGRVPPFDERGIEALSIFPDGGRGFAGSPRAADYTTKSMADHLAQSRERTTVVVQIEDLAALPNVAEIAAVDGIDCLFVGRIDLAVAMQKGASDAAVLDAVRKVCADVLEADPAVGMFTPTIDELPEWLAYAPPERACMVFDRECAVETSRYYDVRRFWDDIRRAA